MSWVEQGACRGLPVSIWFPDVFDDDGEELLDDGHGRIDRDACYVEAKAICALCSAQEACLEYALDNFEHFGVWGGTSPVDRQRLRRNRRRADLKAFKASEVGT